MGGACAWGASGWGLDGGLGWMEVEDKGLEGGLLVWLEGLRFGSMAVRVCRGFGGSRFTRFLCACGSWRFGSFAVRFAAFLYF